MRINVRFAQNDMKICVKLGEDNSLVKTEFKDYQEVRIENQADRYEGKYDIIPSVEEQTIHTANKYLERDLLVCSIPYYETSNAENGETVYIGTEVTINGNQ